MAKLPNNRIQMQFTPTVVDFDVNEFDNAIRGHGVKLVHYRGMPCPVGQIDQYDERHPHEDHSGCSNGFLYTKAGILTCLFTGVSEELKQMDFGLMDGSTVMVTSPRQYDDNEKEVHVAPFDRFYLQQEEIIVPHWQRAEYHITGKQKLSFPVVEVTDVVDNTGKFYGPHEYRIENGQVVWIGAGPGYDASKSRGHIFSIRYNFRPFWYCRTMMHQVRVAQVDGPLERAVVRMPQQFLLQREVSFEKENKDELAPNPESQRQVKSPRQGQFGPR